LDTVFIRDGQRIYGPPNGALPPDDDDSLSPKPGEYPYRDKENM
jgi:hypothetical protein